MIFHRFYDAQLAQASFLIGCVQTGEALVIDPTRRVERYLAEAATADLRITGVTETHIHADFVSGSRELAARTGATVYLSGMGGTDWQYRYAAADGAVLLRAGSVIQVGRVRLDVLHTPGHTPEHLSFMVTDGAAADGPIGIVTGDFVFAGDVGRPDLLERAVGVANAADGAARVLYQSLQRFAELPDHLQVWPGHGAGSACGKGLSAMPQTTVGYEKRYNWAFGVGGEEAFVASVLTGQPDPPRYFKEMKRINRDGPPILGPATEPRWLPEHYLKERLAAGDVVVDLRPTAEFAHGHVPGTINIPLNRSFTSWAGWFLPYDRPFYLIADASGMTGIARVAQDLTMIGLERIGGYFGPEVLQTWTDSEGALERSPQTTLEEAMRPGAGAMILDVRNQSEWDAGHVADSTLIPLGLLPERLAEVPRDRPVLVHCQSGARSAIAVSLLQAAGYTNVANLGAGYAGWAGAGMPVVAA